MSYARSAVTRMTLDMSRPDLQRSETVTLGDTNRRWEVTLINGGAPFRLPPNWTAALTGIKPDGTGLLNGCSVVDGKIIYDFAAGAEIATCAGNYPVQFDIWDEVGDLVASPKIYVNVLDDVRPHAELDSNGQYTLIGDLIGRVNQTEADVDLLGETALAQGDDIAALKEKVTTAGSVTIPTTEWSDDTPRTARFKIDGLGKGMTALLYPSDEETRKETTRVKLSAYPQLYMGTEGSQVEMVVSSAEVVPTKALNIDYIVIKTDNTDAQPRVALIGVDAYGEGGGTASGVDEAAVKSIIKQVMPEWTQAETPPSETDPTVSDWAKAKTKPTYTAPEVGLGNVANVRQYSADNPPPYPVTSVNGQVGSVNLPIPSEAADVGADPVGTAEAKLKTHNTDNDAHEYIQQRIDALRTLVENFLDIDDESFDQLSEILRDIRANTSALELLGTNKVDKTAISTSMTDSNPEHVASMILIVALDNALTVVEQAIEDLKTNKQTAAQVSAAINNALSGYLTSVKAAELYQPKGDYLTPDTGDQRYPAKQTTEDALMEHGEKIAELEEALANSMVEYAESVEWLEANGNTEKTYYLPDGYEYTYRSKYVEIPHNANTGDGDYLNYLPSSTWGNTAGNKKNGFWVSPVIEIDPTTMGNPSNAPATQVTVSGIEKVLPVYNDRQVAVWYYKADGTLIMMKAGVDFATIGTNGELTTPFTFTLKDPNTWADSKWATVGGVRIGLGISTSAITDDDIKDLVVNIPFLDFKGYKDGWYSTGKLHSDDPAVQENANNIADLQERMTAAEEKIASGVSTGPLFAKLGLIGDSLTNQEYQGWQAITVSMLGNPEWHKNAITGSSVANYGDGREANYTPFVDRYLNTPSDCDCIVIMGGTNDATYQNSYDMGTVGVLADNTFKGAYSTIIEGLLTRNPATRLMLMVPPRFYNVSDDSLNANIGKYAEAVREIAKHYALPCLDLFDLLGQNKCTAEWGAWDWANNDPIHFSNAIAPRVGRMVANFIRQYY